MMPEQQSFIPDVDSQRVQALRSRIEDEAYIVNSRQIADKVIDMEDALFCSQQHPA